MTETAGQPARQSRRPPMALPRRLLALYLRSRHVPGALGLLVALGAFLWADLNGQWSIAGGAAAQKLVPLTVIAGATSVIGAATYGAFGEPERATGRWLPYLRLGTAVLLTAAAAGLIAIGATGGTVADGDAALARNLAGSTGIALLTAAAIGGQFAWIGPIAYWLVTESALAAGLSSPLIWPGRPADDSAASLIAVAVAVAGLAAVTARSATPPPRLT